MILKELEIKQHLYRVFFGMVCLEEWEASRSSIADFAVINQGIHCFEIKGETDTLKRLEKQIIDYSKCFTTVTVVAHRKHISKVLSTTPDYVGVLSVETVGEKAIRMITVRPPGVNPNISCYGLVQFLWKDEAYSIAKLLGHKASKLNRKMLWKLLSKYVTVNKMTEYVAEYVLKRNNWKFNKPVYV